MIFLVTHFPPEMQGSLLSTSSQSKLCTFTRVLHRELGGFVPCVTILIIRKIRKMLLFFKLYRFFSIKMSNDSFSLKADYSFLLIRKCFSHRTWNPDWPIVPLSWTVLKFPLLTLGNYNFHFYQGLISVSYF